MSELVSRPQSYRIVRVGTQLRGRRIVPYLLGVSACMHLVQVLAVHLGTVTISGYGLEFLVVVTLSFALEPVLFASDKASVFRILVVLRIGFAMIGVRMLGSESGLISIFFAIPLICEISIFDDGKPRRVLLALACVGLLASVFFDPEITRSLASALFLIEFALLLFLVVVAALSVDYYREELARYISLYHASQESINTLSKANQAFQRYADNVEDESAERERHRIAGDLHDTVGYALTNVSVMMKAARIRLDEDPDAVRVMLEQVEQQSNEALGEVRATLHQLRAFTRPAPKGHQAIFGLARAFQGATNIQVTVHRGNLPDTLGHRLDVLLYRIAQEALTNAFRHGHATEISIYLWKSDKEIAMAVRDNGVGVDDASATSPGIGLAGIRERLAPVGGELVARPVEGGFELAVRVPFGIGRLDGTTESTDRG